MKILVIGSEGTVGTVLVPYLESKGHDVVSVDILRGYRRNFYQADITQGVDLAKVFYKEKPKVVYHLAAMVSRVASEENAIMTANLNLLGLYNVIELCKLYDSKLINFSTSEIYGNLTGVLNEETTIPEPNNRYGLSKYLGEKCVEYEVKNNGLKAITVRPFMLYHPDAKVGEINPSIIEFALRLSRKERFYVHKNSERSWLHLDDAVKAFEKMIYIDQFEVFNIGSDEYIKTEEIATLMANEFELNINDYADFIDLPSKMTLEKRPDLTKMETLLGVKAEISIYDGLKKIASKFK